MASGKAIKRKQPALEQMAPQTAGVGVGDLQPAYAPSMPIATSPALTPLTVSGEGRDVSCSFLVCVVFISLGSLHEGKFSLGYLILAFSHGNTQGHNPTRRKTAQKLKQQLASHE